MFFFVKPLPTLMLLLCVSFLPGEVKAEPLNVLSGGVSLEALTGIEFALRGQTFQLFNSGSIEQDRRTEFHLGDNFNFTAGFGNHDSGTHGMVNGINYDQDDFIGYFFDFKSDASFNFPTGVDRFNPVASFIFTGTFTGRSNGPKPAFTLTLRGRGKAEAHFDVPGDGRYILGDQSYHFEPIPEPTTMLLLGTGLAGTGGMIKRRRQGEKR